MNRTRWFGLLALWAASAGAASGQDARAVVVEAVNRAPEFHVRVSVDKPERIYRDGESMTVNVRSTREGYLYLLSCYADGTVACVYPNQYQTDNRIETCKTIQVPAKDSGYHFKVRSPFGYEVFKAVVTSEPISRFPIKQLTQQAVTSLEPAVVKEVFEGLRAVKPEKSSKQTLAWAEHHVDLLTMPDKADAPKFRLPDLSGRAMPESESVKRRVGVFIGISTYLDRRLQPIPVCRNDAAAMADVMKKLGRLDDVLVLRDEKATLREIEQALRVKLKASTRPGDEVFIYWSGHGHRVSNRNPKVGVEFNECLVPYDGKHGLPETARSTMLVDTTFGRWMQELDGRRILVVIDACHSGGQAASNEKGADGDVPFFTNAFNALKDINQPEAAVLASSRASEESMYRIENDMSVMTYFLIEQLKSSASTVTVKDAYDHVRDRVPAYVRSKFPGKRQTPVLFDMTATPLYVKPQ